MQDRKYASDLENEGHVHQRGKCKLKAADLSVKERQFPASTLSPFFVYGIYSKFNLIASSGGLFWASQKRNFRGIGSNYDSKTTSGLPNRFAVEEAGDRFVICYLD